jgi:hypothetical protein
MTGMKKLIDKMVDSLQGGGTAMEIGMSATNEQIQASGKCRSRILTPN